ncbi:hypothetical protein HQQ81_16565 [Microbacteriaceae bacterium VKM Ac-2854]|nr:hypothetical protein [Microbacteriaceae bacterium VKM Ac-2854]
MAGQRSSHGILPVASYLAGFVALAWIWPSDPLMIDVAGSLTGNLPLPGRPYAEAARVIARWCWCG